MKKDILLLTEDGGREIAVFVNKIKCILPALNGRGTVVWLAGSEETFMTVREPAEDILHTLCQLGVTAWRIRPAPKTPAPLPEGV